MISTAKPHFSKRLLLFPILFFMVYLSGTVLLFVIGPWPYPIPDSRNLFIFLALAHLALLIGYLSAYRKRPSAVAGPISLKRLMLLSITANLLLLIPTAWVRTGSGLPDIIGGLNNPGAAYDIAQAFRGTWERTVVESARIFLGPILALTLPLTIFYWQHIRMRTRILATFAMAGFLGIYLATGTNKLFADYILLIPWVGFVSYKAGFLRLKLGKKLLIGVLILCVFIAFLWFFSAGQQMRYGSGSVSGYMSAAEISADPSNIIVRPLWGKARTLAYGLTSYLTQGYYGLYLSMNEPFVPMFGLGNSMFLYLNAAQLTGDEEIAQLPYPVRAEKHGWSAYGHWSTIYPWIASDVTFPGTVIVLFIIGRLFALAWVDSLVGNNPFAIAAFSQFVIMLSYFPANNQVMQSGESFMGFVGILGLWLFTRKKRALPTKKLFSDTIRSMPNPK